MFFYDRNHSAVAVSVPKPKQEEEEEKLEEDFEAIVDDPIPIYASKSNNNVAAPIKEDVPSVRLGNVLKEKTKEAFGLKSYEPKTKSKAEGRIVCVFMFSFGEIWNRQQSTRFL